MQINCSGAHRHRHIGLLLLVGGVLLDRDQRILLHRVIGTVGENDLRHSLRAGLHDVAFFKRNVVVCGEPGIAARLFYSYRPIQGGDVRLLRALGATFGRHSMA